MQVIYIAGAGRSGSTLLEMILGNLTGFYSIGEVRYLWEYWNKDLIPCGCKKMLSECDFWSEVMKRTHLTSFELEYLSDLSTKLDRSRNLLRLETLINSKHGLVHDLIKYTELLYQSIWETSGRQIIVDSSKVPSHLLLLQQIPSIDLRVLHLIRDGRAVVYSWSKRNKRDYSMNNQEVRMGRRSSINSLIRWAMENIYTRRFSKNLPNYYVMRYENLTKNPSREIENALSEFGIENLNLTLLENSKIKLNSTHSVGGNPVRFRESSFSIETDLEWIQKMRPIEKTLLGLISKPVEFFCDS
jgi:hypothetical protein